MRDLVGRRATVGARSGQGATASAGVPAAGKSGRHNPAKNGLAKAYQPAVLTTRFGFETPGWRTKQISCSPLRRNMPWLRGGQDAEARIERLTGQISGPAAELECLPGRP